MTSGGHTCRLHEERVVGDVPCVGACHGEGDAVADAQPFDHDPACQYVLGRAQLSDQRHRLVSDLRTVPGPEPDVFGDHLERLVVLFRGWGAQVVGASAQYGERVPSAELDIQDLGDVPAAVGGDRTAWFDPEGEVGVAGEDPAQSGAKGGPVEHSGRMRVVDAHSAADVDFPQVDSAITGPILGPSEDLVDEQEMRLGLEAAGKVEVEATQSDAWGRLHHLEAAVQLYGIHAERPTAHGQGDSAHVDGQVDAQQYLHGPVAQQSGEQAEFVFALDVQALGSCVQRAGQILLRLARATEGDRRVRDDGADVVQFAAGGHLEAVDVSGEGSQDPGVGVGLGRVQQFDAFRQCGADRTHVLTQVRQVVDVGGQIVVGQCGDEIGHLGPHRTTSRGKSSPSGLGTGT
jgi:hypothetical protein